MPKDTEKKEPKRWNDIDLNDSEDVKKYYEAKAKRAKGK